MRISRIVSSLLLFCVLASVTAVAAEEESPSGNMSGHKTGDNSGQVTATAAHNGKVDTPPISEADTLLPPEKPATAHTNQESENQANPEAESADSSATQQPDGAGSATGKNKAAQLLNKLNPFSEATDNTDRGTEQESQVSEKASEKASEKTPEQSQQAEKTDSTTATGENNADGDQTTQSASVDEFSARQSQLKMLKLDVQIAEERKKLNELEAEMRTKELAKRINALRMASGSPAATPAPAKTKAESTTESTAKELAALPKKPKPKPLPPRPRIISIQGVDNNLTATLKTPSGKVVVSKGDTVDGGTVVEITLDRVRMRYGSKTYLLRFN